jgi:hypothetical protein
MTEQPSELHLRLIELVRRSPMLMRALHAARAVDPPDWLIGAGVIRDLGKATAGRVMRMHRPMQKGHSASAPVPQCTGLRLCLT